MQKTECEPNKTQPEQPSSDHSLSTSNNPNPPPRYRLPPKAREEGELSQSDDDENPASSAPQSNLATNTPATPGHLPAPLANHLNKENQAGKAVSGTNLATIQSRLSVRPKNDKSFQKNHLPPKSANRGKFEPTGANNSNLVISFSDDDSDSYSDSEPENLRREHALEVKQNKFVINGNQRMVSPSLAKSVKLQQTVRRVNKIMPKNSGLARTFNPSLTKNNGVISRVSRLPSGDPVSQTRNFNSASRNFASQEHSFDHGMGLTRHKLQDLRQQIALRERELKLKAMQQNKEPDPVSVKDMTLANLSNDASRSSHATSDDVGQLANEPERKRLKIGGSYSMQLTSDGGQEILVPHREEPSENIIFQDKIMADHKRKRSPSRSLETNIMKWKEQHDSCAKVSAKNLANDLKNGSKIDCNTCRSQSERTSLQEDPCVSLNRMVPRAAMNSCVLQKKMDNEHLNHTIKVGHVPPCSFTETSARDQNVVEGSVNHVGEHIDKTISPLLNNTFQASGDCVKPWNGSQIANVSELRNLNVEALVDMEGSLDKELEEAQEFRHKCEIEERNALKAYRKAQRALIEANARCKELYRKRELYASHYGSILINDSNLLWSSRQHESVGIGLDSANIASRNLDLVPTSSHQMHPGYDLGNQLGYDANIKCVSDFPLNKSSRPVSGQNLGSEPCSEPDASTSEPLHRNRNTAANGTHSLSYDTSTSADEDEDRDGDGDTFSMDHENGESDFRNQQKKQYFLGTQKDVSHPSQENCSINGSQDSLILEARLRSELFARLRTRTSLRHSGASGVEPADVGTENEDGSDKTQTSDSGIPFSVLGNDRDYDLGGNDKPERNISEAQREIQDHEKSSPICHTADGGEGIADSSANLQLAVFSPPFEWKSAFAHMKTMVQAASLGSECAKVQQDGMCDYDDEEDSCINFEEVLGANVVANAVEDSLKDICGREIGSLTCPLNIDPFWPLCMFELRGKCNNDKCPWQHVKDLPDGNVCHQHEDSAVADSEVGSSRQGQKHSTAATLSKSLWPLTPPTYLVGLDTLKADACAFESILARRDGQSWQKSFSSCLVLSNLLQKDFPADEPLLHGIDGRIEVHGSWNRQLPYFHSRNVVANHLNQASSDNVQTLEVALLVLGQEVNKLEGMKRALSVLSRAIEVDPTSELLWIIYLFVYHCNVMPVGKDDMFSYAVKHIDGSYGLWLMYINSRIHLDDRLVAYDAALTALCRQAYGSERDKMHAGACILDLFLQKLGCLCMSGNVEKAIKAVYSLFPVAIDSDEPHSPLLSDILACLTISDKLVLWVCCVYLVIYRKLPDAVVERFECDKELPAIEWPSVQLSVEEKEKVVKLMEKVGNSVRMCVKDESLESEINLKAAHHFALNHVRCMVAIGCLACCCSLLDDYLKLYPSCLELVLVSARIRMIGDCSFQGFEEALGNWPKEVPGINCIWNQYFECAVQKEDPHVKELTVRWFNSILLAQYPENGHVDIIDGGLQGSLESASVSNPYFLRPLSNPMDIVFGYLNFALAKLLQNDHNEARLAINKAMRTAGPLYIKHCIKELAMFMLVPESHVKDGAICEQLNILRSYLDDVWAFPVLDPLSRQFINNVEKARVRQLVSNILCPVSPDVSLVNLFLEVWYGPSLVPQKLIQPKDIVDFVEAVLAIVPSNYQFALSVCKLLREGYDSMEGNSSSILYWASSTLVNSLFLAVPLAPEYIWVEAAGILGSIVDNNSICDRFYKRALSVYPFSLKLWNYFCDMCKARGDANSVVQAAREKGIILLD